MKVKDAIAKLKKLNPDSILMMRIFVPDIDFYPDETEEDITWVGVKSRETPRKDGNVVYLWDRE